MSFQPIASISMPDTNGFFVVDNKVIPLADYIRYLSLSGTLEGSVAAVLKQYFIECELNSRVDEIEIADEPIHQSVIEFRLKNQLVDIDDFNQWLQNSGMSYDNFLQNMAREFKVQKLREIVIAEKVQDFFVENKLYLDRVVISRILVNSREMADEIYTQIQEGKDFESLARRYSSAPDGITNGMMGILRRGDLPDQLRGLIDNAQEGDLIGPIEIDEKWSLFRLEAVLSASLENGGADFKASLENAIFEEWIGNNIRSMNVELRLS